MRPIQLRIDGLRSYRTLTTIDFADVALMGIIGATGSGKSSILEGICYALYGLPTDGNEVKELISSGLNTIKVQFTFSADGNHWQAYRSTSHSGQTPVAWLKCVSDDSIPQVDGRSGVTDGIEKLIGLDRDAFLKSVILPQGRFAELLDARDAPRATILKGIFRLDVLDLVREVAREKSDELDVYLRGFEVERAGFLENPAAEAAAAAAEAKAAQAGANELRAAQKKIKEIGAEIVAAYDVATRVDKAAEAIEVCLTDKPSAHIQALQATATSIESEEANLAKKRAKAVAVVGTVESAVKALDDRGVGESAMEVAVTGLNDLAESTAGDRNESKRLDQVEVTLGAKAKQLASARKGLAGLDKQKAPLATKRQQAAAKLVQSQKNSADAGSKLQRARQLLEDAEYKHAQLLQAQTELHDVAGKQKDAAARLEDATKRRDESEGKLGDLQRQHAAAHAATGLKPGDQCPVCSTTLPQGFHPPRATGLNKAESEVKAAREAFESARQAHTQLVATAQSGEASVKTRAEEEEKANRAAAEAKKAIDALLPHPADLSRNDANVLRPLAEGEEAARKALEAAETSIAELDKEIAPIATSLQALEQVIREGRENITQGRKSLAGRASSYENHRLAIAEAFRPATLEAAEITTARARAKAAADTAKRAGQERMAARSALSEIQTQQDAIGARQRSELEKPLQPVREGLVTLRTRLKDSASVLAPPALPAAPDARDQLSKLLTYSTKIEGAAAKQASALWGRASAATTLAETKRADGAAVLGEHGCSDQDGLTEAVAAALAKESTASGREKQARGQVVRARELDKVIGPGAELRDALRELAKMLAPGAFVDFVVKRKQKTLLGLATDVFQEMTGGRFGFSADFQIVDTETGQPRSPRTLSGGERFLASLALSLGLVELAARGGGRLDSLFLDEGFGTLDNDSLADALDALEKVAGHGRMIALITHIRAVADRLPRVLKVTRTPAGSQAHWLSPAESDADAEAELSEGMLT